MTKAQKKNAERKRTQERLYDNKKCGDGKTCAACKAKYCHTRPKSCRNKDMVRVELREVKKPVVMFDEEISAHQFSLHNRSAQAEADRFDVEMQTSVVTLKSHLGQTSKQDAMSMNIQTSEIEKRSGFGQTSNFGEPELYKNMHVQTDPKILVKRS